MNISSSSAGSSTVHSSMPKENSCRLLNHFSFFSARILSQELLSERRLLRVSLLTPGVRDRVLQLFQRCQATERSPQIIRLIVATRDILDSNTHEFLCELALEDAQYIPELMETLIRAKGGATKALQCMIQIYGKGTLKAWDTARRSPNSWISLATRFGDQELIQSCYQQLYGTTADALSKLPLEALKIPLEAENLAGVRFVLSHLSNEGLNDFFLGGYYTTERLRALAQLLNPSDFLKVVQRLSQEDLRSTFRKSDLYLTEAYKSGNPGYIRVVLEALSSPSDLSSTEKPPVLGTGEISFERLGISLSAQSLNYLKYSKPAESSQDSNDRLGEVETLYLSIIPQMPRDQQVKLLTRFLKSWKGEQDVNADPFPHPAKTIRRFPPEVRAELLKKGGKLEQWDWLSSSFCTLKIRVLMVLLEDQADDLRRHWLYEGMTVVVKDHNAHAFTLLFGGMRSEELKLIIEKMVKAMGMYRLSSLINKNDRCLLAVMNVWHRFDDAHRHGLLDYEPLVSYLIKDQFHGADPQFIQTAIEPLSRDELLQSLRADYRGEGPLHQAVQSAKPGMVSLVLTLLQGFGASARAAALEPSKEIGHPLHACKKSSSSQNLVTLIRSLSRDELQDAIKPSPRGCSLTHSLALAGQAEALKALFERLGSEQRRASSVVDTRGNSALHAAAFVDSAVCVEFLAGQFDTQWLNEQMQPNYEHETPLHVAVQYSPETVKAVLSVLQHCDSDVQTRCFQPTPDGDGLLHLAARSNRAQTIRFVAQILKSKGLFEASLGANRWGNTPLHLASGATRAVCGDALYAMSSLYDDRQLQRALKPNQDGYAPVFPSYDSSEQVLQETVKLLDRVPKKVVPFALAIGAYSSRKCASRILNAALKKHLSSGEITRLAFAQIALSRTLPYTHEPLLGEAAKHPAAKLTRWDGKVEFTGGLAVAFNCLNSYAVRVLEPQRRELLTEGVKRIIFALVGSGLGDPIIIDLKPLWSRLIALADPELRLDLTRLMVHHPPGQAAQELKEGRTSRAAPLLYLLGLDAMGQRGAKAEILLAIDKRVQGAKRQYSESGSRGKAFLRSWTALALCGDLSGKELNGVLHSLLKGDLLLNSLALAQLLKFGGPRAVLSGLDNLRERAKKQLKGLLGVTSIPNFDKAYEERILTQRDPQCLITYASQVSGRHPETWNDFKRFVSGILGNSYYCERYAPANSAHLAHLYEKDPSLKSKIRKLCGAVGKTRFKKDGDSRVDFPFGREQIEDKVLEDKLLDPKEYPLIIDFLQPDKHTLDKYFGGSFSPPADAKTEFQLCLMLLCADRSFEEKEKQLYRAQELCQALGLTAFGAEVNGAIRTLERSRSGVGGDYEAFVTDHYWDLFRIGTDVNGSCQHIYNGRYNHRLMGVALDGRTFAVAVTKVGKEEIQARQTLRIEIINNTGMPALFIERVYGNVSTSAVQEALRAKAIDVANYLGYPLFSKTRSEQATERQTLKSLGNAAHSVYIDGATNSVGKGCYEIDWAWLIHDPRSGASSSN